MEVTDRFPLCRVKNNTVHRRCVVYDKRLTASSPYFFGNYENANYLMRQRIINCSERLQYIDTVSADGVQIFKNIVLHHPDWYEQIQRVVLIAYLTDYHVSYLALKYPASPVKVA